MSLFTSPLKLVGIIKDNAAINKKIAKKDVSWYFSEAGKQAYTKATTQAEKTEYFYTYFVMLKNGEGDLGFLQKLAFVFASAVDGTSKPYGNWPDILNPKVNPLVKFVQETSFPTITTVMKFARENDLDYMDLSVDLKNDSVAKAIAALQGKDNYDVLSCEAFRPYSHLTKYSDDSELFFIERSLIFTFCSSQSIITGIGPYCYGALIEEGVENE